VLTLGGGSEAVIMRTMLRRQTSTFSYPKGNRWRFRFLRLQRRRFRLAELSRDPFELHFRAFQNPAA